MNSVDGGRLFHQAIILGVKRHGETSVIAEVMTRDSGRHLGLVRS
ncbi:recombination protein O N-terminal domain-containing protein, partial [Rhizobium ruizarguesonis]